MQVHSSAPGHPRHQQVLLIRHAALLVVDHLAIAIKREPILGLWADEKDGHRFVGGCGAGKPLGQRARRVGVVQQVNHFLGLSDGGNAEERANPIEKQHQNHHHACCYQTQLTYAEAFHYHQDQRRRAAGGQQGHHQRMHRRRFPSVGHKPRQQEREQRHHAAQSRVAHQHPPVQSQLPAAEKIVPGENRDGRNRGQNIAG